MSRGNVPSIARWLFLVVACCCASPAFGNGVVRDGVGAISIGRGGTNLAFWDNTAVLLDNPAGMVGMDPQSMFQISVDGLLTDMYYEDPARADRSSTRPMGLPEVGYMRRTDDGVWAWGFAVAVPAGFGMQFELGPETYSSFAALAKFLPGVACQVTEDLSVGATVGVGVCYAGLDGPFVVQTGPLAGVRVPLDVAGAGAAFIWSLGMQYRLSDATTLGIAYQSQSRFSLEGNAQVVGVGNFDSQLDITWPSTLGAGLAHWLNESHRVSADVILVQWADAFDTIGLQLSNPGLVINDQFPFRWRDSVSVRLGYEYFLTPCSILRAGYVYNSNQVPDGTLTPYVPATLEHGFSIGAGHAWGEYSVDIAYQYSWGPDRRVGTSDLVGGDFNNSFFEAEAHWLALSLTRQF